MSYAQHTKDQHYISQEYLRGFSQDSKTVFEYNLRLDKPIDKPVSIESVCKEKYLYELRDEQGEFIYLNYLEKILCDADGHFAEYRRQILRKAVHKENYKTKCFLSKDEKLFWTFYSTLNLMRNPVTLDGIKEIIQDELHGQISDQQAYNMAVTFNLPFFSSEDIGKLNGFSLFHSLLNRLVITVAYAESDDLFTSDHAMFGSRKIVNDIPFIESLWFPLSSNCGLIFSDPNTVDRAKWNCLVPLSADDVRNNNKGIAELAIQYVLSKHPFSESDIALIREARQERAQEDALKKQNNQV